MKTKMFNNLKYIKVRQSFMIEESLCKILDKILGLELLGVRLVNVE